MGGVTAQNYPTFEELEALRQRFARGETIPVDKLEEIRRNTSTPNWRELCRQREAPALRLALGPDIPLQVKLDAIITKLMGI